MDEKAISSFISSRGLRFAQKHLNPTGPVTFKPQYKLDYGGTVDWAVFDNNTNKIIGLIECKGEPDLTDFVRGLGQVEQYYYSMLNSLNKPASVFAGDAKVLYVADKATIKKIPHWDLMHFSKADNLVLIDGKAAAMASMPTDEYALYKKSDINKISAVKADQLILSDIPFTRDVRLYEVYMGLMALYEDNKSRVIGNGSPNKNAVISKVLKGYSTVNKGNARNVGILVKDLGLIDDYNVPNSYGMELLKAKYVEFVKTIVFNHYNSAFLNIVTAILNIASQKNTDWRNINVTQLEIKRELLNMYGNRKLKNLTDDDANKNNYIGTYLLILENDLGAVTSVKIGRTKQYSFNYLPLKELALTADIDTEIYNRIPFQLKNYMNSLGYIGWEI